MSLDRKELAENLLRLNSNAYWRHYVIFLETKYESVVEALLNSEHPDEALRGECRAYAKLLKQIHSNNGTPT